MDWDQYIGHHRPRNWFATAVKKDRLASSFLLVGPLQVGKRTFARLIAKTLFCQNRKTGEFSICNRCEGCAQVEANTHPDLIQIAKPADKSTLPAELLVGSPEHRMREGLCYEIRKKPFYGQRRIAIIDDADFLTEEIANVLLKTLEEPPAGSLIFLIARSEQRQLPTIRSRTQTIRFNSLSQDDLSNLLLQIGWTQTKEAADALSKQSDGTLGLANQLRDENVGKLHETFGGLLQEMPFPIGKICKTIEAGLKSVGDDGQTRRQTLQCVMQNVIENLRHEMRTALMTAKPIRKRAPQRSPLHPELAVQAIQVTLEVQSKIDRNLAPTGLIEAWAVEMARIVDASRAKFG